MLAVMLGSTSEKIVKTAHSPALASAFFLPFEDQNTFFDAGTQDLSPRGPQPPRVRGLQLDDQPFPPGGSLRVDQGEVEPFNDLRRLALLDFIQHFPVS